VSISSISPLIALAESFVDWSNPAPSITDEGIGAGNNPFGSF